jgi:hypothetical protein
MEYVEFSEDLFDLNEGNNVREMKEASRIMNRYWRT